MTLKIQQKINQDNSLKRKRRILMTIGGTWGIALLYLGIYLLLVHSGIGMFLRPISSYA